MSILSMSWIIFRDISAKGLDYDEISPNQVHFKTMITLAHG